MIQMASKKRSLRQRIAEEQIHREHQSLPIHSCTIGRILGPTGRCWSARRGNHWSQGNRFPRRPSRVPRPVSMNRCAVACTAIHIRGWHRKRRLSSGGSFPFLRTRSRRCCWPSQVVRNWRIDRIGCCEGSLRCKRSMSWGRGWRRGIQVQATERRAPSTLHERAWNLTLHTWCSCDGCPQ